MKRDFLGLRIEIDNFRASMENHPDFDVIQYEEILGGFRAKFGQCEGRIPSDFFATSRLKSKCQDSINAEIAGRSSARQQEQQDGNRN